jgi:hypothetical protein
VRIGSRRLDVVLSGQITFMSALHANTGRERDADGDDHGISDSRFSDWH